jgi:hypothetical protein
VKYTDDVMLLAKEENMLQGRIDGPTEIGRYCEIEMNVEKNCDDNLKETDYDRS